MTLRLCCCRCTGASPRRSRGSARTKGSKPRLVSECCALALARGPSFRGRLADCRLLPRAVDLCLCQSLIWESLRRIPFEVLRSQLRRARPKKRHEKKLHARSLDPWVSSSYPGQRVRACVACVRACVRASERVSEWRVCVFMAELTKVWPWRSLCRVLLQVECRNYIRTLHKVNETTMYVCGTNAFSPTCDYLVSLAGDAESFEFVFDVLKLEQTFSIMFMICL